MDLTETLRLHAAWLVGAPGGARADLSRADLSGADLSGADLSGADLSGADLSGADLSGADLSRADLSRANLSGTNLYRADLRGADLSRADLNRADLRGADLRGADLSRADLSGADLSRAKGILCLPVGDPRGYRPVAVRHTDGWMVASGCRWFPIAEAREHWGAPDYHTPTLAAQYLAALDWLEQQPTEDEHA